MISIVLSLVAIFVASLFFFAVIQRGIFAAYNRTCCNPPLRLKDYASTTRHGIKTDCIISAYVTALPLLILWVYFNSQFFNPMSVLTPYFAIIGVIIALLVASDTALYGFWRTKIDSSVLSYLKSPKGIFASVSTLYVITAFLSVALIALGWTFLLCYVTSASLSFFSPADSWWKILVGNLLFVVILGLLFIAVRGLGVRPNTPSVAYFSSNLFLNHLSLNGIYNFIYSLSLGDDYKDKYKYVSDDEAAQAVAELYPRTGKPLTDILNTTRPNVLIILWESLCARFVEPLGGKPGVTPRLNELCNEGVLFTNCDCGSFLTDRGLACILAGLPGQTNVTVGKHPAKVAKLPGLPNHFLNEGYKTEIVHTGDMTIRQINTLFLSTGFRTLVDDKEFKSSQPHCKWGYHDEVAANRVYDDIMALSKEGKPWFMTWLTLSSHEPFIVPYNQLEDKMDNSFAYTDMCVGNLIDKLKATDAWRDMLVVIVGDHGVHHSAEFGPQLPHSQFPHIPLLFVGGAVKKPMKVDTIMAQTDIAATLLGQMRLDHSDFPFSRDVFADTYTRPMSMHIYNNGFVIRTPKGYTDFDNASNKALDGADPEREDAGKKVLQQTYKYLADL